MLKISSADPRSMLARSLPPLRWTQSTLHSLMCFMHSSSLQNAWVKARQMVQHCVINLLLGVPLPAGQTDHRALMRRRDLVVLLRAVCVIALIQNHVVI